MKITITRQSFLAAFQLAASVASTKSTKPILENVKLEVTEEGSTLIATDTEAGIRVKLDDLEVETLGEVMLPIKRMAAILKECDDEKLTLKSDKTKTVIQGEKSKFRLVTHDPAEFPVVEKFDSEQYHEIESNTLAKMLDGVSFAAGGDEARFNMLGVKLELFGDEATAVATNSHQVTSMTRKAVAVGGHQTEALTIIPVKATRTLCRVLSEVDCEAQVHVTDNRLTIQAGGVTVFTRLAEGRFPTWTKAFIEHAGSTTLTLSVRDFHSAIRQATIMTTLEHPGVDITFNGDGIRFDAQGENSGDSEIIMDHPCDCEEVTLRVKPEFVSDFLRRLDQDGTVDLRFNADEKSQIPIVLISGNDYDCAVARMGVE